MSVLQASLEICDVIYTSFILVLPRSTLVLIYFSLILPHFDYCRIVWDNLGNDLGRKLLCLQNRAAGKITESDYNVRSSDILTIIFKLVQS